MYLCLQLSNFQIKTILNILQAQAYLLLRPVHCDAADVCQSADVTSVNLNISHGTSYELVRARTRPKKGKKSKSNKYKQLGSFSLKSPNL